MPKRQRPKIVKRRRPRPWKTLFAEINRAGPRADLIAELRANSVFSAAMEKYCLMLAQTIAEDIAKAQAGPIEYCCRGSSRTCRPVTSGSTSAPTTKACV
jgi:hypothetical protein